MASSGPKAKIQHSLSITGLSAYFSDNIFSSYDVGTWKPDPGFFLHVSNFYKVDSEECIVIEDSYPGIKAGMEAGMQVFAYDPSNEDFEISRSVMTFREMGEIQRYLTYLKV